MSAKPNQISIPIPGLESLPLPEQILVLRHRKGWTQEELAERAGVTQRTIWKIENSLSVAQFVTAAKIFSALGFDIIQSVSPKSESDEPDDYY